MWDQKREIRTRSALVLTEPFWLTSLSHFCGLYQWKLGKSHDITMRCLFSHNSDVLFSLLYVCLSPLAVSALFNMLWGRVAGSRSVSEFPEREEVTSGFLCGDGQVLWCYCEGRKTSSEDALLVNVWNLILWARAPVGGNMPPSQSSPPALALLPSLLSHSLYTLCHSVHSFWDFM